MVSRAHSPLREIAFSNLVVLHLPQTTDGRAHSRRRRRVHGVSTPRNDLPASLALPDTGGATLHGVLSAESAGVLGVLGDLDLLDLFPQRSTIAHTVLTGDMNL